jgi:hypothetical protein
LFQSQTYKKEQDGTNLCGHFLLFLFLGGFSNWTGSQTGSLGLKNGAFSIKMGSKKAVGLPAA